MKFIVKVQAEGFEVSDSVGIIVPTCRGVAGGRHNSRLLSVSDGHAATKKDGKWIPEQFLESTS